MWTPCNVQTKQTSKNKKLVESQWESYCLLHGPPFFCVSEALYDSVCLLRVVVIWADQILH